MSVFCGIGERCRELQDPGVLEKTALVIGQGGITEELIDIVSGFEALETEPAS